MPRWRCRPGRRGSPGRSALRAGRRGACPVRDGPARRRASTRAGRPGARSARCRSGSGRPTASRCCWRPVTSSAVPSWPSGPGWFWARVSTMNAWLAGTSSPVPGLPSGPTVRSGSSALSGTKTVPPLLTVWSTPWSKNWPKKVNIELYGGERPTSVVTLGMNSVWCDGTQPTGTASTGGSRSGSGSVVQGNSPGCAWAAHRDAGRGDRGGVGRGLVDDQVADRPRLRSRDDVAACFCL